MVMIRLAGPIAEINGKVGNDIYRIDTCGAHIQKAGRHVNRNPSARQKAVRNAFRYLWRYWRESTTVIALQSWSAYGLTHPRHNKKGEQIYWSGWYWFVHFNMPRTLAGEPPLDFPPV